eukprot:GILK01011193.1.p1 GENE.GILK01011193.1~~GILK01011193.1.p1  ORF type:complete len:908 (+),score=142.88 GILK01011193.1:326-2725(+)
MDNLISKLQQRNRSMVFYGDDTWLRLFPDAFVRSEGVNSFYVLDTVEVDNNVTRHLETELKQSDWEIMILHYLGIDHTGHSKGANSERMEEKMAEMDHIIKSIYARLESEYKRNGSNGLLLILSDHGMTQSGNHGGASLDETNAMAVFLSPKFASDPTTESTNVLPHTISQIDLVPTLSYLLNLESIPLNSLGKAVPSLLKYSIPTVAYLERLREISRHLLRIVKASAVSSVVSGYDAIEHYTSQYQRIETLHLDIVESLNLKYKNVDAMNGAQELISIEDAHLQFQDDLQSYLAKNLSSFDWPKIIYGIFTLFSCLFFFISLSIQAELSPASPKNSIHSSWHVEALAMFMAGTTVAFPFVAIFLLVLSATRLIRHLSRFTWSQLKIVTLEQYLLIGGLILYIVSLTSSSLVEEEHQFWYLWTTTFLLLHSRHAIIQRDWISFRTMLFTTFLFSILRGWNQTGNKWFNEPDFGKFLDLSENEPLRTKFVLLSCVLLFCFALVFSWSTQCSWGRFTKLLYSMLNLVATLTTFISKSTLVSDMNLHTSLIRLGFLAMTLAIALPLLSLQPANNSSQRFLLCMTPFAILLVMLHRSKNSFPIVLLFCVFLNLTGQRVGSSSSSTRLRCDWSTLLFFDFIGQAGFFALGNTNQVATIDWTGAFTGVGGYNQAIVGLFATVIITSPFILASLFALNLNNNNTTTTQVESTDSRLNFLTESIHRPLFLFFVLRLLTLSFFCVFLIGFRYHLFVWSVFAPKFLFESIKLLFYVLLFSTVTSLSTVIQYLQGLFSKPLKAPLRKHID